MFPLLSPGLLLRGDSPLLHPHHPVCHPMEILLEVSSLQSLMNRFVLLQLVHKVVAHWYDCLQFGDFSLCWERKWPHVGSPSVTSAAVWHQTGFRGLKWWMTAGASLPDGLCRDAAGIFIFFFSVNRCTQTAASLLTSLTDAVNTKKHWITEQFSLLKLIIKHAGLLWEGYTTKHASDIYTII